MASYDHSVWKESRSYRERALVQVLWRLLTSVGTGLGQRLIIHGLDSLLVLLLGFIRRLSKNIKKINILGSDPKLDIIYEC